MTGSILASDVAHDLLDLVLQPRSLQDPSCTFSSPLLSSLALLCRRCPPKAKGKGKAAQQPARRLAIDVQARALHDLPTNVVTQAINFGVPCPESRIGLQRLLGLLMGDPVNLSLETPSRNPVLALDGEVLTSIIADFFIHNSLSVLTSDRLLFEDMLSGCADEALLAAIVGLRTLYQSDRSPVYSDVDPHEHLRYAQCM
jgi:hypothetical protein